MPGKDPMDPCAIQIAKGITLFAAMMYMVRYPKAQLSRWFWRK